MSNQETREELQKQIDALKAQNAKLAAEDRANFGLRLGTGGNIVVDGMGGKYNTINLYPAQVELLAKHMPEIVEFTKTQAVELGARAIAAKIKRDAEKAALKATKK